MPGPEDKKAKEKEIYNKQLPNKKAELKAALDRNEQYTLLKESLIEQNRLGTKEKKRELSAAKLEADKVKADKAWQHVSSEAKQMIDKGGMASYQQYATSILEFFSLLCQAVEASKHDNFTKRMLTWAWQSTGQEILHSRVVNGIKHKLHLKKNPELRYSVALDDKGVLTTKVTVGDTPLNPEQKACFDAGLIHWATTRQGCVYNDADHTLTKDGNPLKFSDFEAMNAPAAYSLQDFYNEAFNLRASPRP